MALTKASCEAGAFKALQVQRTVFGVMQNRDSPPSQWIKGGGPGLGQIFTAEGELLLDPRRALLQARLVEGTVPTSTAARSSRSSATSSRDIMYWLFGDIT